MVTQNDLVTLSNIRITEHFSLEELLKTKHLDLQIMPTGETLVNLHRLCMELEIIRSNFGQPIYINSGFRSKEVNKAVGGSHHSDHLFGSAVDISANDIVRLWSVIRVLVDKKLIHMRQIIDEKNLSWIHLSVNNKHNEYKNNEVLHL